MRVERVVANVALSVLLAGWGGAQAQHSAVHDRMLASVVRIECLASFKEEGFDGGHGTGFLVGSAEYVLTNSHVIDTCHPANKIKVLREVLLREYIARLRAVDSRDWRAVLGGLPKELQAALIEDLKRDQAKAVRFIQDPEWREQYVLANLNKLATENAENIVPYVTQRLSVVYQGASGGSVRTVAEIVWSAWNDDQNMAAKGLDLAVLKVPRPLKGRNSVAAFASGGAVAISDVVYTVGYPGGSDLVESAKYMPTIKRGIISKVGGEHPVDNETRQRGLSGVPVIETDAAINMGNSGGPLFNEYGEVIGINTFKPSGSQQGIGWALEISSAVPVLLDLGITAPRLRDQPHSWLERTYARSPELLFGGAAVLIVVAAGLVLTLRWRAAGTTSVAARPVTPVPAPAAAGRAGRGPALRGRRGACRGLDVAVSEVPLVIGRDPKTADVLISASDISARHCLVAYNVRAQRFEVTDLGSTNGTYVLPEGRRLAPHVKTAIAPGSAIRLAAGEEIALVLP